VSIEPMSCEPHAPNNSAAAAKATAVSASFFIVVLVSIRQKLGGVTRCNDRISHYLNVKR